MMQSNKDKNRTMMFRVFLLSCSEFKSCKVPVNGINLSRNMGCEEWENRRQRDHEEEFRISIVFCLARQNEEFLMARDGDFHMSAII